jgi:hypothetical protein
MGYVVRVLAALSFVLAAAFAHAAGSVAVLDFELRDLTLTPDTAEERDKAARLAPLLRQALTSAGVNVVAVDPKQQQAADKASGYLFDHDDAAAVLARAAGADYVAVGRLHKPSPLFSYLMVQLIRSADARRVGEYVVEIKGQFEQTATKGTRRLAEQIQQTLQSK